VAPSAAPEKPSPVVARANPAEVAAAACARALRSAASARACFFNATRSGSAAVIGTIALRELFERRATLAVGDLDPGSLLA
jgi:hypothetical protein